MKTPHKVAISQNNIKLIAYRSIGMVLLAYDISENLTKNLAGFAIKRTLPNGKTEFLPKRISFEENYPKNTVNQETIWFSSEDSPFQNSDGLMCQHHC